jgi:hypothetical protein
MGCIWPRCEAPKNLTTIGNRGMHEWAETARIDMAGGCLTRACLVVTATGRTMPNRAGFRAGKQSQTQPKQTKITGDLEKGDIA